MNLFGLFLAFSCGLSTSVVVNKCHKYYQHKKNMYLLRQQEKIKADAIARMITFIAEMGGDQFIQECERQNMYDTIPLTDHGARKPPKMYMPRVNRLHRSLANK